MANKKTHKKKQHYIVAHPEKIDRLMNAIGNGYNYDVCCNYAGVSKSAFYGWKKKAKEEFDKRESNIEKDEKDRVPFDENYATFHDRLIKNEAVAEIALNKQIKDAGENDWRASAWILERRFRNSGNYDSAQRIKIEKEESFEDLSDEDLDAEIAKIEGFKKNVG